MALIVTAELTVCSAETQASHPELFHYTKPAAFESIVRSNSFWASHYPDIRDNALDYTAQLLEHFDCGLSS